MRPEEIGSWVLNVVDRIKSGQRIEDARMAIRSSRFAPDKEVPRILDPDSTAQAPSGARLAETDRGPDTETS